MALTEKETRLLMEPDGFWRETVAREFIGDQSSQLRSVASTVPATIINLAHFNPTDKFAIHLQLKASHALVFTRLTELKLSTVFRFSEDKQTVYPVWRPVGTADFRASFLWPVPATMGLYFVMMLAPPADARDYGPTSHVAIFHGAPVKFFLIAAAGPKVGGFWRLPLCNIYEDSAICMGTYQSDLPNSNVINRLALALAHFRASPWTADLSDQQDPNDQIALFSFSPKGDPVPPPEKWWTHCKKVNNTNYSDLPLINLFAADL